MPRYEPPHSVLEWLAGGNVPRRSSNNTFRTQQPRRSVVSLDVNTDDELEMDTVAVTYPRPGRYAANGATSKPVRAPQTPQASGSPEESAMVLHSPAVIGNGQPKQVKFQDFDASVQKKSALKKGS